MSESIAKEPAKKAQPSLRQQKVGSFLAQQISEIVRNLSDITGMVTISLVEVTRDMRDAKAWFSVMGQDPEAVLKILQRESYFIQGELFRRASMRIIPKVRFYIDHSEEYSSHINQVIKKL